MPCPLQSRVFSTETLVDGLDLVKDMSSQPNLDAMNEADIERELQRLEAEKQKLQEGEQRPVPTPVRALGEAGPEDETVPADLELPAPSQEYALPDAPDQKGDSHSDDSFEVLQLSLDPIHTWGSW